MPAITAKGAWREIFRRAPKQRSILITIPYALEEVARNLKNLPPDAGATWVRLRGQRRVEDNVLTLNRPTIPIRAKERPILFSALVWSDVPLTLGTENFSELLGKEFDGPVVLAPGAFLGARTCNEPLTLSNLAGPPHEDG